MRHILGCVLVFVFLAATAGAEERPNGLLWNRSGLAATLPLQVKTNPGADYLIHLRDLRSGEEILAAYIRGGEFFRVLVPPGRYEFLFATGRDWQGEDEIFGPETQHFKLDRALEFRAEITRKEGQLIDLRVPKDVTVRDFALCQRLALDPESLRPKETLEVKPVPEPDPTLLPPPEFFVPRYDLISRVCD